MTRFHPVLAVALIVLATLGCIQHRQHDDQGIAADAGTPSMTLTDQVVEAGCAQCMFGLDIPDCETAIRVDGVVFIATGSDVPDAEDHATGMCQRIQQARVSGQTSGAGFVATSFVLLP